MKHKVLYRIHCDNHGARGIQPKLSPFKHERFHFRSDGLLNCQNLLGYHTQHLQFNSVKLIETLINATGKLNFASSMLGKVLQRRSYAKR